VAICAHASQPVNRRRTTTERECEPMLKHFSFSKRKSMKSPAPADKAPPPKDEAKSEVPDVTALKEDKPLRSSFTKSKGGSTLFNMQSGAALNL